MRERIEASRRGPDEVRRAAPVIAAASVFAVIALYSVWSAGIASTGHLKTGVALALLGMLAEFLAFYQKGKAEVGSAALIPYAASLLVLPDWRSVGLLATGQLVVQVWHRRSPAKFVFNVAQLTLALGCALLVQNVVRNHDIDPFATGFLPAAQALALPATALIVVPSIVNAICIAGVIGAVSGRDPRDTLRQAVQGFGWITGLQVVFVLYLAWLSVQLGWVGALGMALPIIALRQLSKTAAELTNVTEELLDLMVAAIEARDPYTSGHSRRVSRTATLIAKAIRLSEAQVERVQVAALLHDVGKIHEEFARILAKEGRLTPEEWEVMKRHPVRSADLVGLVSSLRDVVPAVRHHHENWDGTGYPDGKRGEEIPLASRIIMFADTLDAITTDRPYRKALDPEEARREFIKFRAKQFDPHICDVVTSDAVWQELYEGAAAERKAGTPSRVSVVA